MAAQLQIIWEMSASWPKKYAVLYCNTYFHIKTYLLF